MIRHDDGHHPRVRWKRIAGEISGGGSAGADLVRRPEPPLEEDRRRLHRAVVTVHIASRYYRCSGREQIQRDKVTDTGGAALRMPRGDRSAA
jgi:hypothetical protein